MSNCSSPRASEVLIAAKHLIKFAILTDPHNEIEITEFTSLDEETRISIIIEYMKEKGYRPITADEYVEEKNILAKRTNIGKNITLWRPLHVIADTISPVTSKKHRHEVK